MVKTFTVRDLPKTERPRERLVKLGPEALSAQELLALIIGRGIPGKSVMNIAQELLSKFGNLQRISEATIEQLCDIKGLGPAKAAQIKACFEIGKRGELENEPKKYQIDNPSAIVKILRSQIKDKAKEHFKLVLLDSRNKIIAITNISVGTLNANLAHPREIFKDALSYNAASVSSLILDAVQGEQLPFSIRLERKAVQLAGTLALFSYFVQEEDLLEIPQKAIDLAIKFYVEEAAVRAKGEVDAEKILKQVL